MNLCQNGKVFSDSPIIIYRSYIVTEHGKDLYWDICFHDYRKLQIECDDYPPKDNENDSNPSTRRTGDELYTILSKADFDYKVIEPRQKTSPDTATRLANDAANGTANIYVTDENERSSVVENEHSSVKHHERNSANENEMRPRPATSRDETALSDESSNSAAKVQMTSRKLFQ